MDLLGVGPMELLLILLIAFMVIGPKNITKTGRSLGKLLHAINRSETWKMIKSLGKELRMLPTKLMREAAIEDYLEENPGLTIAPPEASYEDDDPPATAEDLENGLKAWTTPWTDPHSPDEESE